MSFSLKDLVSSPTVEEINTLRKTNLLAIAQHYKLGATSATSKGQIKQMVHCVGGVGSDDWGRVTGAETP